MTTDPLLALYRGLSIEHLRELRADFDTDRRAEDADAATRAFCADRIAVIDQVLREHDGIDAIRGARR